MLLVLIPRRRNRGTNSATGFNDLATVGILTMGQEDIPVKDDHESSTPNH